MNAESEPTDRRTAGAFAWFVGLGFFLSVAMGVVATHLVVDKAVTRFQRELIVEKADGLAAMADSLLSREIAALSLLAADGGLRAAFAAERAAATLDDGDFGPLLLNAGGEVIAGPDDASRRRVELLRRVAKKAMSGPAGGGAVIADDASGFLAYAVRTNGAAGGAVLAALRPSPLADTRRVGSARISSFALSADADLGGVVRFDELGLEIGTDFIISRQALSFPNVILRYSAPVDALRRQRTTIVAVVSMAMIGGLAIAFGLIAGIGRRVIVAPQAQLRRSKARLRESEIRARQLAMVAEKASDCVVISDAQGKTLWVNAAFTATTGYELKEMLGRYPGDVLAGPETDQEAAADRRRRFLNGETVEQRVINYHRSGELIVLDVNITPVLDNEDEIRNYIAVARDVTKRSAAERRLKEAVNALPGAFTIVGTDERLILCNDAYRRDMAAIGLDAKPGDSYPKLLYSFAQKSGVTSGAASAEEWASHRLRDWREAQDAETLVDMPDGRTMMQRDVRTASGEIVSIRADVSELIDARMRAEAAVAAKSRFSASISHELRTPLGGVISMAELLLEDDLDEAQRSAVELIAQSGAALLDIINDILDYSRLEAGKLSIHPRPFDIYDAIEDATALLATGAEAKSLGVGFRYEPDGPRSVLGDDGRIRQIALNLIGNAIKFTTEGRVTVRVASEALQECDEAGRVAISIIVEDTGPGIAAEDLDAIFAPFEQSGDISAAAARDGAGLGLSICRNLAELMGGTISATSQVGVGSTFRFDVVLPAADPVGDSLERAPFVAHLCGAEPYRSSIGDKLRAIGANVVWIETPDLRRETNKPDILAMTLGRDRDASASAITAAAEVGVPTVLVAAPDQVVPEHLLDLFAKGVKVMRRPLRTRRLRSAIDAVLPDGEGEPLVSAGDASVLEHHPNEAAEGAQPLILAAEDNATNAMILRAMMRGSPYRLTICETANETVERAAKDDPALILMDLTLPDMPGAAAARQIRKEEADRGAARTPMLAFTASILDEELEEAAAAGMDGVLHKPLTKEALKRALAEFARTDVHAESALPQAIAGGAGRR